MQKQLNRSRCRLRGYLTWVQGTTDTRQDWTNPFAAALPTDRVINKSIFKVVLMQDDFDDIISEKP